MVNAFLFISNLEDSIKKILALLVCFSLFCSCTPYNLSKSGETSQSVFDPSTLKELSDLVLSSNMFSDLSEGQYREPFKATGTYDLNFDGKEDRINLGLRPRSIDKSSIIQVNNLALELDLSTPVEAYLIDLDSNDEYIEIAVLDDGPSFDPCYYFFRYDGSNIIQLGNWSTDYLYDGHGRIFSAIRWLSPQIVTVLYELNKNKIKEIELDISNAMDKVYTVSSNIDGYFI